MIYYLVNDSFVKHPMHSPQTLLAPTRRLIAVVRLMTQWIPLALSTVHVEHSVCTRCMCRIYLQKLHREPLRPAHRNSASDANITRRQGGYRRILLPFRSGSSAQMLVSQRTWSSKGLHRSTHSHTYTRSASYFYHSRVRATDVTPFTLALVAICASLVPWSNDEWRWPVANK